MAKTKQLTKILSGKIWKFFGGIYPEEHKNTSDLPIIELGIPSLITLPVDRHLGKGGEILVTVGEYVKAGQPLTRPGPGRLVPLHASTSGHILSISQQVLPHPSGYTGLCIVIKPDLLDAKVDPQPMLNWQHEDPKVLLERIRLYGVEGLGGAQFQTAAKLGSAIMDGNTCSIFIVNGCECEPVATCDDRLMQEKALEIVEGIEVIKHILKPKVSLIAIEDNKPKAIAAMKKAIEGHQDIQVRVLPTVYPSGAARNLIKIVTGIEIPYDAHTSDCGIVVDNVETVFAVKQAVIDGIPLIRRVVTVDGESLHKKGNAWVRLGTSVRFVLNAFKLNPERRQRIILGGPFMGFTLPSIDVPITKSATCVFTPSQKEVPLASENQNCIRCGRCARVCPSRLTPYKMYALSKASKHPEALKCGIMDCTECGCCAYVCPSRIPLTMQFRREKAILHIIKDNQKRTDVIKERMNAKEARLKEEARIREEKKKAALARIAAQKKLKEQGGTPAQDNDLAARRAQALEAARARAAKRLENAQNDSKAPLQVNKIVGALPETEVNQAKDEVVNLSQELKPTSKIVLNLEATKTLKSQDPQKAPLKEDNALPFSLRRGAVPKIAQIQNPWTEPQIIDKGSLLKVENPPLEPIVVAEVKKPRYLESWQEQKEAPKLPKALKLTNREQH